jgi:hypothetical protein
VPESSLSFSPPRTADERRSRAAQAVVCLGLLAGLVGLLVHALWRELPAGRFAESLLLAGLATLLAWPLRRWRALAWADALGVVWLLALVWLSGPVPAVAVGLVACAALAIGTLAVGAQRPLTGLLVGLAVLAGLLGWLLPLPVHVLAVYLAVCVALVLLRRAALREAGATLLRSWREAVAQAPRAAAWSVLLAGLASAGAWLPTMQHDDLAYHLGLPWQLMEHGRYALDPTHQVWALAPWAGDVLQGLAQVIARAEARGPLNAVWFVAALAALWRVTALLGGPAAVRWAALALYASVPLTASLLGGMQTETPAVAVMLGLAVLALDEDIAPRRRAIAGACLFGLLCALKPLHAATGLPLLLWLGWRVRGGLRPLDALLLPAIAVVLGASSYAYAWVVAGNPVLPLLNDVFASPYFNAQGFNDPRWQAGLGADVLWRLSFDTSAYLEGWDGGAGLLYVALAGAWLLALAHAGTRALAICATFAIALPLLPLQYARYLQPGLALLVPCLAVALYRALPARAAVAATVVLCVLQLAFQANAQWFLHTGAIKRSVAALGRDAPLFARYAPERLLAQALRARPGARVLVLDREAPYYAELGPGTLTTAWYDPPTQVQAEAADGDASGEAWVRLLQRLRVSDVIVRPATLKPAQAAALRRLGAQPLPLPVTGADEAQCWRLPAGGAP